MGMQPFSMMLLAADAPAEAAQAQGASGWAVLVILFTVFVLPFLLGNLIGKSLRLNEYSSKIGVVLFCIILSIMPFANQLYYGHPLGDAIDLGIDLAGGTNLVFQVDTDEAARLEKKVDSRLMGQMVGAINRRINPSGTEEVTVRQVGSDRIEVIIPGVERETVQRMKNRMTRLGSLEFAILANERKHESIIRQAKELGALQDLRREGRVIASWRAVNGTEKFEQHGGIVVRDVELVDEEGNKRMGEEVLVIIDPDEDRRVTGQYLVRADQSVDESGSPAVAFSFNQRGATLFRTLTSRNLPDKDGFKARLAILLDNKVQTAPNLITTISDRGQITGRFSQAEIDELINVLNAGALEVPLIPDPISEFTISPLLGIDVQEKGITAIALAAGVVFVFMLMYYWFAGLVADLCLVLNLLLVLGTMAFIDATFTLPGLAGLVLTIGMAVDANVLIFERIREETARGASLRMSIQNGFGKAFTTIVDANVTTLITAVVLYVIGTDQVRGFAVTLFIGIVMSMFSSLYFGRLIFDVCERKRWLTQLKMFSIVGDTNWDFIGKKKIAAICSISLVVLGLVSLFSRGADNLDIDFRGGSMVTFEFREAEDLEDIRSALQEEFGSGITLEQLHLTAEEKLDEGGKRYRLRTTEQDTNQVRNMVEETFAGTEHHLLHITVEVGEIQPIPAADSDKDKASSGDVAEFAGGNQVELTLSSEVSESNIEDGFEASVAQLKNEAGQPKYEHPLSLFSVVGTAGSGIDAAPGEVRKYDKMRIDVSPVVAQEDLKTALDSMQKTMATTPIFDEVNSFASSVAVEMQESAVMALVISLIAIIGYIWLRFQRITFGFAAVVALVHDVLIVLGMVALASSVANTPIGAMFAFYDFKINLPMIAAFLTIVGYSLNDTIVVFDRIREVRGKNPSLTESMVNLSLNQTLSRTLLTSLTTFVVVAILYAIGGEGIHGFAFCLVLGVIVGTYSSIYVASPVLLWLMNRSTDAASKAKAA